MADLATITAALTGSCLFGAGMAVQLRAHRVRRRWANSGMGLTERATGLASIAAVPALFPAELETARVTGNELAVLLFRRFSGNPENFGQRLAGATRIHETGWRLDYDLFAVTIVVADRDEAVLAASRIGAAAGGGEPLRDLRVGIAMCPSDAADMLDAVDVALRRMRGFAIVDAVANQLRVVERGPSAAAG